MGAQIDISGSWDVEEMNVTTQMWLNGGSVVDNCSELSDVYRIFTGKRPANDSGQTPTISRHGVEPINGGKYLQIDLDTEYVHTTEAPGELGALHPSRKNTVKAAAWAIRDLWTHVVITRREQDQNKGDAAKEKLITLRTKKLMAGIASDFETQFNGDGTAHGGEAIDGLRTFVKRTPTSGYVGSIDQSSAKAIAIPWRNKYSADLKANAYPATFVTGMLGVNMLQELRLLAGRKSKGQDGSKVNYPDFCFCSNNFWLAYTEQAREFRDSGAAMTAELGFEAARFAGMYLLPVNAMDSEAAAIGTNVGICRLINTAHMYLCADDMWPTPAWTEVTPLQPMDKMLATRLYGQFVVDNLSCHAYGEVTDCTA